MRCNYNYIYDYRWEPLQFITRLRVQVYFMIITLHEYKYNDSEPWQCDYDHDFQYKINTEFRVQLFNFFFAEKKMTKTSNVRIFTNGNGTFYIRRKWNIFMFYTWRL